MKRANQKILIVRTDRIGDVVLSLPIAEVIKKNLPDANITYLVREYTKHLSYSNPFIDQTIVLVEEDGKINLFENVSLIRRHKFDTVIILYPTFIISLIMFLSGIPKRVGTGYRLYSFLFTDRIYEHRKDSKKHELEYNFNLLKSIGIDFQPSFDNVNFNININETSLKRIEETLLKNNINDDEKIIIVHPGSGGSAVDLPIEKLRELISSLLELDIKIILTGSDKEKYLCDKLKLNQNVLNFAGLLTLEELVALISKSLMLIANSTGPIHIAAALGKFTVGFYPKIRSCSVDRWGPYTQRRIIYEPELDCKDCTRQQCEKLNCMNYIDISRVANDIKMILQKNMEQ
jgi:ADP-heptose:LPS heptosyltransferase